MAMSDNSKKVLNYMKEINGADVTAADVAAAGHHLSVFGSGFSEQEDPVGPASGRGAHCRSGSGLFH